jgi:ATP-dependent Lon protease
MRSDTFILLATQKNASDDDPATEAIYEVGTLASVLQLLKLPDGTVKVLVEGAQRAKVVKYTASITRPRRSRSVTRVSPALRLKPFCTDVGHHAASPRRHELAVISFDRR